LQQTNNHYFAQQFQLKIAIMRKLTSLACLSVFFILCSFSLSAQTVVSGTVKNNKSKESIAAVSVTVKGSTAGAYTDEHGNFKFTTSQKPPFTLVVSSVV